MGKKINIDLKLLCHWLNANKISLNSSKTAYILFRHKLKPINYELKLKINGKKLYPSTYIKYLGIFLESWEKHINVTSLKLRRANGALAKLREYACQVWGQNKNSITNSRIFILEKSAMRIMSFESRQVPMFCCIFAIQRVSQKTLMGV